jgi:16S rRNA (cytidine1402-2'-O)-methyltransferase
VWRGTLEAAVRHVNDHEPIGEYVVVLDGAPAPTEATDAEVLELLRDAISGGMSKRDAAAHVAAITGRPKRLVYSLTL